MSRILYWITSRHEKILRLADELKALHHITRRFIADDYYESCPYLWKKVDEWGFTKRKHEFYTRRRLKLFQALQDFKPEIILFINFRPEIYAWDMLRELSTHYVIRFWFVDSVVNWAEAGELKPYDVSVFERDSVRYLAELGIDARYCPVGYSNAYWRETTDTSKDIDVSFVGSPYKNRLVLLEQLAAHAERKGWRLKICGPFYERRYFWKKYIFARLYPHLFRVLDNAELRPTEIADIYARSRICLNIHDVKNRGTNPRTFEIMAAGSLELMDARQDYDIVEPQKHVAVFADAQSLIEQVDYYLTHADKREEIAFAGHQRVHWQRSMRFALNEILHGGDSKTPKGQSVNASDSE